MVTIIIPALYATYRKKKYNRQDYQDELVKSSNTRKPETISEIQDIVKNCNENDVKIMLEGANGGDYIHSRSNDKDRILLDLKLFSKKKGIQINSETMIATVGPTTTWLDIMKKASEGDLNLHVKCSQTILFFTVAGSISVNSHNRNLKVARVSDTLISLTIVRPDGEIEELTPGNDLFNYVVGGYGLMGIIIEAKIQLEKNFNLDIQQNLLTDITKALTKAKENKNIELYNLSPSLVEGNNECMEIIYTKSEVQDPIEKFNYKEFENINDLKDNLGLYLKLSLTRLKIFEKIIWWVEKKWWFGLTESESVANNYPPYNIPYFKQWELMEFYIPIINTKQFIDDVKILLKKKKQLQ